MKNEAEQPCVNSISSLKLWEILKDDPKAFLVDVRTPEEWKEVGIADLSSISKSVKLITLFFYNPIVYKNENFINELEDNFPDKEVKLFFICKASGRSLKALLEAQENGYKNCYNIEDGFEGNMANSNLLSQEFNGWINNKLPRIYL